MKKIKHGLLLGAAIASGSIITACHLRPQNVYGPPVNIPEAVYGPPAYWESEENIPEDVYGPPAYWDGPEEVDTIEIEVDAEDPEEEISTGGTPSEEKTAKEETEETGEFEVTPGVPSFEAQENVPVCVYGPPEYFEGNRP